MGPVGCMRPAPNTLPTRQLTGGAPVRVSVARPRRRQYRPPAGTGGSGGLAYKRETGITIVRSALLPVDIPLRGASVRALASVAGRVHPARTRTAVLVSATPPPQARVGYTGSPYCRCSASSRPIAGAPRQTAQPMVLPAAGALRHKAGGMRRIAVQGRRHRTLLAGIGPG